MIFSGSRHCSEPLGPQSAYNQVSRLAYGAQWWAQGDLMMKEENQAGT